MDASGEYIDFSIQLCYNIVIHLFIKHIKQSLHTMTFNPDTQKLSAHSLIQSSLSTIGTVATFCFNTKIREELIGHIELPSEEPAPFALHTTLSEWEKRLAQKLFAIPGVVGITYKPYEISIQLHYSAAATKVKQQAQRIIESYLVSANQIAHSSFPPVMAN